MAKVLAILVVVGCAVAVLGAPAGPSATGVDDAPDTGAPDGRLVLALLSPERAMVADPRSGTTRERWLAGGTLCHGPVLGVGDRVVLSGMRGSTPVARSLPLTLRGAGRSLGPAATFAAAADERVVLARWTGQRGTIRSVGVDGDGGAAATARPPRWSAVEGVVGDDVLISHGWTLGRWDLRDGSRQAIGRGWAIATDRARVAWCPRGCRRVRVWSPGGSTATDPPRGTRTEPGRHGAFSPDGRLALPLRTAPGVRVGVVDLATGRWRVVRHSRLGGYRAMAWSPSGRWLYFGGRGERLFAWRPGAERPIRLPIRTGGTVMSIATVRGAGERQR